MVSSSALVSARVDSGKGGRNRHKRPCTRRGQCLAARSGRSLGQQNRVGGLNNNSSRREGKKQFNTLPMGTVDPSTLTFIHRFSSTISKNTSSFHKSSSSVRANGSTLASKRQALPLPIRGINLGITGVVLTGF